MLSITGNIKLFHDILRAVKKLTLDKKYNISKIENKKKLFKLPKVMCKYFLYWNIFIKGGRNK